LFANVDSKNTP
jgi:hypothetical protein